MLLTIEITQEQHRRMESIASLQGKTVHEFVLDSALPETDEVEAIEKIKSYLNPRIEAAQRGEFTNNTFDEIVEETLKEVTKNTGESIS